MIPSFLHPPCPLGYCLISLAPLTLRRLGTRYLPSPPLNLLGNTTSLGWSDRAHTLDLVWDLTCMEDTYVQSDLPSYPITDILQSPKTLEVITSASVQMLKNNGHYLRAKMMAEQQAIEIARLMELIKVHEKDNNNLKVQNKTLKYV